MQKTSIYIFFFFFNLPAVLFILSENLLYKYCWPLTDEQKMFMLYTIISIRKKVTVVETMPSAHAAREGESTIAGVNKNRYNSVPNYDSYKVS